MPAAAIATVTHLATIPDQPPESLETLFREHHERVFRAAYRLTGSAADAEDVLQTVFLRLAGRGGAIDLSPSPAAYLHRAAVNASLDLLRAKSAAKRVALDDVASEIVESPSRSPEAQQVDRELRRLIRAAISRLGATAAEMFALRYLEGYGNAEIAQLLGTSQMTVGVTLHRARTRMRKEIGEYLEKHHEA